MARTIREMRAFITEIGRLMFDRHLTDSAGGNLSVRMNDLILITPRMAGSVYRWCLDPEQYGSGFEKKQN